MNTLAIGARGKAVGALEPAPEESRGFIADPPGADAEAEASCDSTPPSDEPPTVQITSPEDRATVSGNVGVKATAADDVAATQVEFFVDGESIGVDVSFPYEESRDTTSYSEGTHIRSAVTNDNTSQTGSDSVDVSVQNVPPDAQEMYIGDLEGTAQTVNKKSWRASVTIPVLAQGEIGLSRASVTGNWTGVYEGTSTCTTGASGTCGVTSGNIRVGTSSVTFNVNGVTAAGYVLDDTGSSLEVTSR